MANRPEISSFLHAVNNEVNGVSLQDSRFDSFRFDAFVNRLMAHYENGGSTVKLKLSDKEPKVIISITDTLKTAGKAHLSLTHSEGEVALDLSEEQHRLIDLSPKEQAGKSGIILALGWIDKKDSQNFGFIVFQKGQELKA